ncbi:hypothetical protein [Streptomyces sp. NBC_00576]|uniref:hypothetical protein n=1 Tax=Streptomyces sp. NBC_00576 TaxID=2903665 RepID=UPI002E805C2C|nr:hypothetical protein [Streptomyces sp. NBC_00576]WUB74300.1 hypothetical protein OG734_31905 [Streptomyces sp. NBC_00576]
MRALPARRIASTALCATLLVGIGAQTALAADGDAARERGHAASQAPVPNADALLAQVKSLGDLGGVVKPVTDLTNAVLKADNGQLPLDEATKLTDAVKEAIAAAAAAPAPATPPVSLPATPEAPATPAVPATPEAPATPAVPTTPEAPATPAMPTTPDLPAKPALPVVSTLPAPLKGAKAVKGPLDIKADALVALQKSVDALLKAVTSGDAANVVPAVTDVLTNLVGFVAATLLGGELPAPELAGLPPLPKLPAEAPKLPDAVPPLTVPAR